MPTSGNFSVNQKGFVQILLIFILLAVVGAVGYFVFFKKALTLPTETPYDKVFQAKPQPVVVKPVKTEELKSAVISEKGGVLTLEDKQQELTLSLPDGALLSPEEISLQSLKTIDQLPEGYRFIAGAELAPDGLGFVKSSTLSIKLPPGTPTDNLVAFAYEQGGQNFYFQPYSIEGDVVEIPLSGFSGGGVIDIPGLIPIINPGTPEQTSKQLLADVIRRAKGKMLKQLKSGQEGSVEQKLFDEARGILNAWYQKGVKPDLKTAEKDDAKVDEAIKQMLSWRADVQLFGLDQYFQKEFQESLDSTANALAHAEKKADERCFKQNDPRQITAMLRWLKIAQLLGVDSKEGLRDKDVQEKVKNCAIFELSMDSAITGPEIGGKTSASLKGTIRLNDELTSFIGDGTVNEDSFTYAGGCAAGPTSYGFTVLYTRLNTNLNPKSIPKISLLIDFAGEGVEAIFTCPLSPPSSIPAVWISYWFSGLHEDEAISKPEKIYFFKDWKYVGKKDIYAQKIYNRSEGGVLNEDTKFILKHTPRK